MVFELSTSYMSGFPMSWELFSILVTVCFVMAIAFCLECFGRLPPRYDIDTQSQGSTTIPYDITAPDVVDMNEYDVLNNDDRIANYETNSDLGTQPCSKHRSSPIPIPKLKRTTPDKCRYVAYSEATTVCADDIYRRENKFSSSDDAWQS